MLLFDPKTEAAAMRAAGQGGLEFQKRHLIKHLVQEKQYKLA